MKNSEKIIKISQKACTMGLIKGTWGNISLREGNKMWITPSGVPYENLNKKDIAIIDINTKTQIEGKKKASSEWKMHILVYEKLPNINGICHTHSEYSSAFAVADNNISCHIEDQAQIVGGDIEVANYAFPGSQELAQNIVEKLKNGKFAVLMKNHGLICIGRSVNEALVVSEISEKSAKILSIIYAMGQIPSIISQKDIDKMREIYLESYSENIKK